MLIQLQGFCATNLLKENTYVELSSLFVFKEKFKVK